MNPRFLLPVVVCLGFGPVLAQAIELPAVKPERGTIFRWVTLPASFAPWQEVDLRARVAGYLKTVKVDSGDRVKAGQILIEIEVPDLAADLIQRKAEAAAADIAAKRLREALAKSPDLVLPQDVDNAEARLTISQAGLDRAQTLLDFAQIKAPFAATVSRRLADPGAFAAAGGEPLLRLTDTSTLRLRIAMVEIESGLVRLGQPVEAKVDALGGQVVSSKVSRVSGVLDPATRTMWIEADFPNADDRLRPGMFASARVGVERHDGANLIPVSGLVKEKSGSFVFKLVTGKAVKTPVKPGFNDGAKVEVPDLAPGDLILLPGTTVLTDGQEISLKQP